MGLNHAGRRSCLLVNLLLVVDCCCVIQRSSTISIMSICLHLLSVSARGAICIVVFSFSLYTDRRLSSIPHRPPPAPPLVVRSGWHRTECAEWLQAVGDKPAATGLRAQSLSRVYYHCGRRRRRSNSRRTKHTSQLQNMFYRVLIEFVYGWCIL